MTFCNLFIKQLWLSKNGTYSTTNHAAAWKSIQTGIRMLKLWKACEVCNVMSEQCPWPATWQTVSDSYENTSSVWIQLISFKYNWHGEGLKKLSNKYKMWRPRNLTPTDHVFSPRRLIWEICSSPSQNSPCVEAYCRRTVIKTCSLVLIQCKRTNKFIDV